jgi:DnaJ domain
MEQQKAAKALKKELRDSKKVGSKDEPPVVKPTPEPVKGGGLAVTKKEPAPDEQAPKKSIYDQIDDDWASDNPSEDDAKAWINAHIEARFNPSATNVESRTADYLKDNFRGQFESRLDIKAGKFSDRIIDRDSYAKAAQASEAWQRKNRPENVASLQDEDNWLRNRTVRFDGLKPSDIPGLEKKIATTKSEAVKKKAMKDLASLRQDEADLPAIKERVKRDVARQTAIHTAKKADRIEQLKQEFDAEAAKQKTKMESMYADLKKGKKSAVEDATFEAANHAGVEFRRSSTKRGTYEPPSNSDFQDRLKELAVKKDTNLFKIDKKTTKAEIRKQYRTLAESAHPDKPGGSAEKFRRLTDAYNKVLEGFD